MRKSHDVASQKPLRLAVFVTIFISALLLVAVMMLFSHGRNNSAKVSEPYHTGQSVKNKQTAIEITKQAVVAGYGAGYLLPDQVYDVHLKNGNWYVDAWVPPPKATVIVLGGGIHAVIRQSDGRVLTLLILT